MTPKPQANKTIDEILQKFDKLYPCINSTCDNNGIVINGYPPDDYFPEQCQYCDQNRFPILALLTEARIDEVERLSKTKWVDIAYNIPRYLRDRLKQLKETKQ